MQYEIALWKLERSGRDDLGFIRGHEGGTNPSEAIMPYMAAERLGSPVFAENLITVQELTDIGPPVYPNISSPDAILGNIIFVQSRQERDKIH